MLVCLGAQLSRLMRKGHNITHTYTWNYQNAGGDTGMEVSGTNRPLSPWLLCPTLDFRAASGEICLPPSRSVMTYNLYLAKSRELGTHVLYIQSIVYN